MGNQPNPKFGTDFQGKPTFAPIYSGGKAQSPKKTPEKTVTPVGTLKLPGATTVKNGKLTVGTIDPNNLRAFLRSHGYDVAKTGALNAQLKSALADFINPKNMGTYGPLQQALNGTHITGARDPKAWNTKYGTPTTRLKPMLKPDGGPNSSLDMNGNPQYPSNGSMSVDLSGQTKQAADLAKTAPIGSSLSQFGKMIDPSTADAIAGEQYDPQIREAQLALARDPYNATQHAADINSYYGQVLGSQDTARKRDTAAYEAAKGSLGDAGAKLVASLGGSANTGAGEVAAAAADATGTMGALQQAEDQYHNDLRPLLQNEKADMAINQSHQDTAQQQADQLALENFQGQRGQAKTTATANIDQQNNALAQARAAMGLDIRNSNNALAQQAFNNSLSLAQAQIAAEMSGITAQTDIAKAHAAENKVNNPFLAASPTVKNKAFQQAMASLYDPSSGSKLKLTPQQAAMRVNGVLRGFGFHPAPGTPSGAFGSHIVQTWQVAG